MLVFRSVPIDSQDARLLLDELNSVLTGIVGNNGTMHFSPDDFVLPRSVFLVGYDDNIPVCCAGIREMGPAQGEIKRVYARPNHRGFGAQLMMSIEDWALSHGYTVLFLECRTANGHAIRFYQKNGYTVCDNYPPYVGVADAVCLSKEIGRTA